MNPVKAGLCSAAEYLQGTKGITDTSIIRGMLEDGSMKEFINRKNDDQCMDLDETTRKRATDEQAKGMIHKELDGIIPAIGKAKERKSLNASINRLIHSGISIRQLSRLTGISKKVIENALE